MQPNQRERVEKFLTKNYKGKFIISDAPNADGKYEVSSAGNVILKTLIEYLTTDDFIFTKVKNFNCSCIEKLKSLKGAPQEVECFVCSYCDNLKSLDEMPICDTLICDKKFKISIPTKRIKKEVILR